MATHSSILAWRMPRTEEPNRPKSLGSQTKSPTRLSDGTATTAVLASPRCYFLCPQSSVFPYLHSFGFFRAGAGGGGTLSLSSHMLQHSPPPTILFIFLAASHGMQDISSPTRYQIHAPLHWELEILTTGSLGKSSWPIFWLTGHLESFVEESGVLVSFIQMWLIGGSQRKHDMWSYRCQINMLSIILI